MQCRIYLHIHARSGWMLLTRKRHDRHSHSLPLHASRCPCISRISHRGQLSYGPQVDLLNESVVTVNISPTQEEPTYRHQLCGERTRTWRLPLRRRQHGRLPHVDGNRSTGINGSSPLTLKHAGKSAVRMYLHCCMNTCHAYGTQLHASYSSS